jgi:hypothetical protein
MVCRVSSTNLANVHFEVMSRGRPPRPVEHCNTSRLRPENKQHISDCVGASGVPVRLLHCCSLSAFERVSSRHVTTH